jgi:hypothetical protein
VADSLPEGIDGGVAPMTTPLGEMFMFTVDGPGSLAERRSVLEWIIRPALRTVAGVADVNVLGGYVRSFEVVPDPVRMAARGVDIVALEEAIAADNRNDGAGRINEGEEALLVRSEGRIRSTDDLANVVVAVHDGVPIRVADVATVQVGSITRYGAVTQSGEAEAVQGLVLGLRGANAREVVEGARAKLAEIAGALPEGTEVRVFYDRGNLVDKAVSTVARALAEAWPGDVERNALIAHAFRARRPNESHRARLRVEIGRLRKLAAPLARIEATARGFELVPRGKREVAVLVPPIDGEQASLLALLADGAAWSTSALAQAQGASQRTVQRALAALEREGRVRSIGRARAKRWLSAPVVGFTTILLLPASLPPG